MMKIVAIAGSLRAGSSNARILRMAASVAPEGMAIVPYDGVGALPHFNPDIDVEPAPPAVAEWRALLRSAQGLVISCPEYAHGVPGAFKNALDWIVSSNELHEKPIVLINASASGGEKVGALLTDTLEIMEGRVLREASIFTPVSSISLGDPALLERLRASMERLAKAIGLPVIPSALTPSSGV
jgi:NAD(P)H-dependent FMN reductase